MTEQVTVILNTLDPSFNLQETKNYTLVIQFSEHGFTYAILDHRRNRFLGLQQFRRTEISQPGRTAPVNGFADFLKQLLQRMPWLRNPYKAVLLAYEGKRFTLVPGPLFDPAEREGYLKLNFRGEAEEQYLSDHLTPFDSQLVFSMPGATYNAIRAVYPSVRIQHHISVLLDSISMNFKNRISANRVFLHLREKFFDLVLFDGRQMSYCNSFSYLNAEDIVYYLVFVLEQLNLNPEAIHVVLLGQVDRSSGLYELMAKYVRHIEFGRRNDTFRYCSSISQLPPQGFFTLLNYPACAL